MRIKLRHFAFTTFSGYLILLIVLPIGAIFQQAFSNGWRAFLRSVTGPMAVSAFELTVETALIAALINVIAGTFVAYMFERQIPGKTVLNAIVDLPFAIPTTVSGLMLIFLYGPTSPIGMWFLRHGIHLIYSPVAIVIAMVFVTFPYTVRSVQPLLGDMDRGMQEAAATLGARPFRVFRSIVFPTILPGVLSGFSLSFSRALAEFGAVVMVAGNKPMHTEVAAVYLYGLLENDDQQGSAAVSVVLVAVALLALIYQFYLLHDRPRGTLRSIFARIFRQGRDIHDTPNVTL
ncbi:ABC transporter permease [Alicyclobacillus fastidiosus]|uniref:Sulfate ABC transporter permease subunit n=1 Tax=Alicyclobacillus fastidiosus TaxID=392011 RepID=A0ABV5A9R5_9BACL|nr:sulfate ABC transporter permease subunit [Alicyclobacillus fastidiosus]WEH10931.1 sulfate ABC transporter permease subunit [Alicyclobacillus fastidiosus]